jgi:hypothetical protein
MSLAMSALLIYVAQNKAVQLALHRWLAMLQRPQPGKGFPLVSGKSGTTMNPRM